MPPENPHLAIDRALLADAGTSTAAGDALHHLCDRIGPRFAGTPGYQDAAEYMRKRFLDAGLTAELEPFSFTAWQRGPMTTLLLTHPFAREMPCYDLPYSPATGKDGLSAEVIDIGGGGEADLKKKAGAIAGRIVLTDASSGHRMGIYARCVEAGAVGFLFAGRTPGMILPTGSVREGAPGAIPAVGIAHESACLLKRLLKQETLQVRLETSSSCAEATTWNVVGELPGQERPEEIVFMGGHLDSHDIGPGAFDNAAGAVVVMESARLLGAQKQHLKRTVRFIGFAGEEVGLLGSEYYAAAHADELKRARFMLNCDMPAMGRPKGLVFHDCPGGQALAERLGQEMTTEIVHRDRFHSHSDHYPFIRAGLPTAGLIGGPFGPKMNSFYHMAADTPDKVSIPDLRESACFAARVLLRAANDEDWLPRRTPEEVEALLAKAKSGT